jgi:hypothetical protein
MRWQTKLLINYFARRETTANARTRERRQDDGGAGYRHHRV